MKPLLFGLILSLMVFQLEGQEMEVRDEARARNIPIILSFPTNQQQCSEQAPCPVAFVSAGYGVPHTGYTFLTKKFNESGYLTVAVRHELPSDPPLSKQGDLYTTRSENWIRGARTLSFLQMQLAEQYPAFDFNQLVLIGHSNGGDISAWLANNMGQGIRGLITLDHRRVPLPRLSSLAVLSIRASDFPADEGVLPSLQEQREHNSCVVTIDGARHNDMWDAGDMLLKAEIIKILSGYLEQGECWRKKL